MTRPTATATAALAAARRHNSTRRHQRVLAALERLAGASEELTVAAVARAANVDRSFLYRHTTCAPRSSPAPPRPSPMPRCRAPPRSAAVAPGRPGQPPRPQRAAAPPGRQARPEGLSEALGEEVFRAAGLGASAADETEQLRRCATELEPTLGELRQQLAERTEELDAACAANRELMAELNRLPGPWRAARGPRATTTGANAAAVSAWPPRASRAPPRHVRAFPIARAWQSCAALWGHDGDFRTWFLGRL